MFVITLGAVPRMDGKNTVFGRVVNPKGLKILEVCRAHVCTGTARCS
jgi:cyclophilin family peptidyl-prolyl cis-trans isomerase